MLFVCFWLFSEPAMKVAIGDPVLPIEVRTRTGTHGLLSEHLDDGLVIFLFPGCDECQQALSRLPSSPIADLPHVILFVGEIPPDMAAENCFSVRPEALAPYQIKQFPALLLYRTNALFYAYIGPLKQDRLEYFRKVYEFEP